MAHAWIAGQVTVGSSETGGAEDGEFKPDADFNENGPNAGIQDRRQELMERIKESGQKKPPGEKKEEEHYWKEWFSIVDRHAKNSTLKYEWWSEKKVDEAGILSLEGAKSLNEAGGAANVSALDKQLRDHGISTDPFGKGQ